MSKHDYELAQAQAQAVFDALKINCTVSAPRGTVRDDNWPCIEYDLVFTNAKQTFKTQFRLGVGHVKWPKRFEDIPAGADVPVFNTLRQNPNAQLKNKLEHAIAAALLAKVQKVSPKPCEVLATVCRDGFSAHNASWEQWAGDFGSDPDSIKAKAVYDECTALYWTLASFIGEKQVEQLAELANRF